MRCGHRGTTTSSATLPCLKGLDITILVSTSARGPSSEAVELLCPLPALRKLVAYEISNQDLIGESLVIVNGVRISLNLQEVE